MNTLKSSISMGAVAFAFAFTLSLAAAAQPASSGDIILAQASAADMTDGEIRKVDKDTKKITIKHGDIKNLDMPGMTMVFRVKDAAILDNLKTGDKIRFKAEQAGSAIIVTEILPAK